MVFSMVPLSVFAANGGEAEVITAGGATTSFLVYADAVGYANRNGGTLKLLDDITVPEFENLDDIPFVTGEFTLDLNGKSINYVDVGSYNYDEEADEEIKGTPGTLTVNGGDNLTADERTALETLRETAKALLDRIADAKSNVEAKEITNVEDITEENVKSEDKDSLEDAKKALKDALRDFDGNYTDDERDDLEKKLETVNDAISAIENAAFFVFRRRLCLNRRVDNYF